MNSITDADYRKIADEVYKLDPIKQKNKDLQRKIGDLVDVNGRQFQVIDAIGNSAEPTTNNMQAMAVAPVDVNGNVDYSEVVIAYAGTNFGDMPDVMTDLQNLGLGSSVVAVLPSMSSIGQLLQGMRTMDSVTTSLLFLQLHNLLSQSLLQTV